MSASDILRTFDEHKTILDKIYNNNIKKDHVKSTEGIDHCFVINLMEKDTQHKLLSKLTDVYKSENSSTVSFLYLL